MAGENITDNLVIAMILKGLPESYKSLVVVHTQLDKYKTLSEFKAALNNYANTEALRSPSYSTAMVNKTRKYVRATTVKPRQECIQCLSCGKAGHKSKECRSKHRLKCQYCGKQGHTENICFGKKKSLALVSSTPDFSFVTTYANTANRQNNRLLVDCGATCHIINDEKYFISYDSTFEPEKHFMEVADGRRSNKLAKAKGNAKFTIVNSNGLTLRIKLKNALLAPEFPTSLFSFSAGKTTFELERCGKLYFLPSVDTTECITKSLEDALGHMNYDDIINLESALKGTNT